MKKAILLLLLQMPLLLFSATLHVGPGYPYPTLPPAAAVAQPGDTIEVHSGTYAGGLTITDLKGQAGAWITIRAWEDAVVIFEGGSNAIQFVEPAYLHLKGLIFQHQTGNGVNTDDGGTYDTPAHHVIFEDCIFRDMSASGNNDLLKLSGLDSFEVRGCTFRNGAAGGSGVDMVGCHYGTFSGNHFENMGSNSIQCKGGSEHIRIENNFFRNGGQRALNLGGSTGLQFFRPDTAHFEAANLQVYANIFVGSWAPIAYVGSVGVEVVNNTFYQPEHWVIRILQETVDPERFIECGDNTFRNNIIYRTNSVVDDTNIGPNTRPETFLFSNNLWFNADDANWAGPELPVADVNGLVGLDPLFVDAPNDDFHLLPSSPAIGAGFAAPEPKRDFYDALFALPPSIGAAEGAMVSGLTQSLRAGELQIFPNPGPGAFTVLWPKSMTTLEVLQIFDPAGRLVIEKTRANLPEAGMQFNLSDQPAGTYVVRLVAKEGVLVGMLVKN